MLLETTLGTLVVDLYVRECPASARNFLALAKLGAYDGCLVFSVQPGFVAQTGDRSATGRGGASARR